MARNRFTGSRRAQIEGDRPYLVGAIRSTVLDPGTEVGPTATLTTSQLQGPFNVGDLCVVHVFYRGNPITVSVSVTGGQGWIKCAQHLGTTNNQSIFFCRFNGTWAASPVFTVGSGTETMIAVMSVWRPTDPTSRWALDLPPLLNSGAGPGFTIAGVTPVSPKTVAIAAVSSLDDNEWINTTPGRWGWLGVKQYRSTGGTDGSLALVGLTQNLPTATGSVTLTETTNGTDAGITTVVVFKEVADAQIGALSGALMNPRGTPASKRKFRQSPRAFEAPEVGGGGSDVEASGTLSITGAAALNATGDLLAAGSLSITGAAALNGAGNLVAAGSLSITGAADIDAIGALVAAGSLVITGAADLDATGNLVAAGSLVINGAADLTSGATNDIAAAGTLSITGAAALNATGSLAAAGTLSINGAADLTQASANDISAAGSLTINGNGELTAIGQLLASGTIVINGLADLDSGVVVPPVPGGVGGGGGGGLWYDRRRVDRKLKKILDDVAAEVMYRDLIKSPDAKAATKIVKPFAETKKVAIPRPEVIDWGAVERDAAKVRQLVKLWNALERRREIDLDDDDWFLMSD